MAKLPRLSGKEVIKALSKVGFVPVRQKGSHIILKKQSPDGKIATVVPNHKEIDIGTLAEIIRQSKLTKEEFKEFYSCRLNEKDYIPLVSENLKKEGKIDPLDLL